jgi:curved DNA-binding protein CbpA
MSRLTQQIDFGQAAALLGVTADADEKTLREAYLQKVREHPPDRDPERFEQIRDAYEHLRDPRTRARQVLRCADEPGQPLTHLLEGRAPARRFVGAKLWLDVLKEARP